MPRRGAESRICNCEIGLTHIEPTGPKCRPPTSNQLSRSELGATNFININTLSQPHRAAYRDVLVATGYYVIFLVFKENTFSSATIEVAENQRVISTGPYAVVRHPMYAGGLLYLLGIPLALGSWWAFLAFAAMVPFLVWRLFDEEKVLERDLPGYAEYKTKVRSRLIPGTF
jgi:protein-S-isoprenylcysteine O-methyltransferase Ste14